MKIGSKFPIFTLMCVLVTSIGSSLTAATAIDVLPKFVDKYTMSDCANSVGKACIEKFYALDSAGQKHTFSLTGKAFIGDDVHGPNGRYINVREDEYSSETLKYPGLDNSKTIIRAFVFPLGNNACEQIQKDCWGTQEFIHIVLEPSWLDASTNQILKNLPHRKSNLLCGTVESPILCTKPKSFEVDLEFVIEMKIPKDFNVSFVDGRAKSVHISELAGSLENQFKKIRFSVRNVKTAGVIFSENLPDPYLDSQYSDFYDDRPVVTLYSDNSSQAKSLGKCAKIPSISVVTNGTSSSVPIWNPAKESIEVSIAGPHFNSDGSMNQGVYEARISREIGKCLWGIDLNEKSKAEISITEEGTGERRIVTAASKFADGYFFFTLSNFHFSGPKLSLSIQKAVPQSKGVKSIVCTKGTRSVTRTAINPTCPKGYKLKN